VVVTQNTSRGTLKTAKKIWIEIQAFWQLKSILKCYDLKYLNGYQNINVVFVFQIVIGQAALKITLTLLQRNWIFKNFFF